MGLPRPIHESVKTLKQVGEVGGVNGHLYVGNVGDALVFLSTAAQIRLHR